MVQLNPAKWGSEKRKKNRRILEIKNTLRDSRVGGRSGSKRRQSLKKELSSLGGKTYRQEDREDRKARKQYDRDHQIRHSRRGVIGYKEGYDPSKGIKGHKATNKKSSKSSNTSSKSKTVKGRKLSPYEARQAERKAEMQKRAGAKTADYKAYKKGNMSLSDFIKKHPTSITAREAKKKGSSISRKLKRESKNK